MTAKVYVTLKKAVLDPQGKAVERSLAQLGLRIGSLKPFLRRPAGRARGRICAESYGFTVEAIGRHVPR